MTITITDLPFETLSSILEEAAQLNVQESPIFTYGLTEAPEPLRNTRLQIHVRGMVPPDMLRWDMTDSIRQVHPTWHYWALDHSFKELYIRRWRGSERWLESHEFPNPRGKISSMAVYRDSFRLLKKTAKLLTDFPGIACHVRRVWFNGFYVAESNQYIFDILRGCKNLRSATLPWTAMRHGQIEGWAGLLDHGVGYAPLASLELLAVDLKESQKANPSNGVDNRVVEHQGIDFSQLTRLKMFGNTNFNPICDGDLKEIAKTARNLREIHITGMSSISIEGILALLLASSTTVQVLEYSPLSMDGFEHPDPNTVGYDRHICPTLLDCPRLQDLTISVPSLCPGLFSNHSVNWSGDLQVRAAGLCGREKAFMNGEEGHLEFACVLSSARSLIAAKARRGVDLDIEIFVGECGLLPPKTHAVEELVLNCGFFAGNWIFEPRQDIVHGNFGLAQVISDFTWPSLLRPSGKGPYGQTGLYGKDEGPYSCIPEASFFEGLERSYISF